MKQSKRSHPKLQEDKLIPARQTELTEDLSSDSSEVNKKTKSIAQRFKEGQAAWNSHQSILDQRKQEIIDQIKEEINQSSLSWPDFMKLPENVSDSKGIAHTIIKLKEEYLLHQEKRKEWWPEDQIVEEMNQIHAIIRIKQTHILTEITDEFGLNFNLESEKSLELYYKNERLVCSDGKTRSKAQAWLMHPNARKLQGIRFDPTTTKSKNGYYNIWKGFSVDPKKGDCSLYWAHVRDNICDGNEEIYQWVRQWLAYVFQHPDIVHTGLVLCGSQGVGKNKFVDPLGKLLGQHYAPLTSIEELTSNFNAHLQNSVLIHANEALWGGHKSKIGIIKGLITDPYFQIEQKGKDRIKVKNFRHVIISSNEPWPVAMDPDDRRFQVLNVADHRKNDRPYFKAIQDQLEKMGYEALLHDLLHEDISVFDPRKMPDSSAGFNIKLISADSSHRYIYNVLKEGGFSIGRTPVNSIKGRQQPEDNKSTDIPIWQHEIPKEHVYIDYTNWCAANGENSVISTHFGKALKKLIPSVSETRPTLERTRTYCYELPNHNDAKKEFCIAYGADVTIFE